MQAHLGGVREQNPGAAEVCFNPYLEFLVRAAGWHRKNGTGHSSARLNKLLADLS